MNYKKYKKIKKEFLLRIEKSKYHVYEIKEYEDQELLYVVDLLQKEGYIEAPELTYYLIGTRSLEGNIELSSKGFEFCYNQRPYKRLQNVIKENATLFTLLLFVIFSLINILIVNDFKIWKYINYIFK
jgi:hypothetical protein